jgi:hypothetical protein
MGGSDSITDNRHSGVHPRSGDGGNTLVMPPPVARVAQAVTYTLDANDVIASVGGAWDAFALSNGAPELVGGAAIGRSLWAAIASETTRQVYRQLLARARAGHTISAPFCCDGPTVVREMRLRLRSVGNGHVECTSIILCETADTSRDVCGTALAHDVLACSWCERVRVSDAWHEPADAMLLLGPASARLVAKGSHGLCPRCQAALSATIAA